MEGGRPPAGDTEEPYYGRGQELIWLWQAQSFRIAVQLYFQF